MTTVDSQLLYRHAILLQLEAAAPASLPPDTICQGLRLAGHDPALLPRELSYLEDKGLLASSRAELAPHHCRYRLTASGRDYLERQALA